MGALVLPDQRLDADHLGEHEPGPEVLADHAEGEIRDPRHGSEHKGGLLEKVANVHEGIIRDFTKTAKDEKRLPEKISAVVEARVF